MKLDITGAFDDGDVARLLSDVTVYRDCSSHLCSASKMMTQHVRIQISDVIDITVTNEHLKVSQDCF